MERSPVVTIMGHVDHGKTTLLDSFRHSTRVNEEFGSITQSIGAFTFKTDSDYEITFIDTPGHEAFNNLRVRGAKVTDIIILVISAIESVQPQTVEVIEIARSMRIPVIVAINKIDRPAADPDTVILDLASHNLIPEQLGGDVICVPVSAKERINLDILEQKIVEVSEAKLKLQEDISTKAQCFVIESNFDEKTTQITATVLVKKGTLR
jgi:translation initiation factor IF-2